MPESELRRGVVVPKCRDTLPAASQSVGNPMDSADRGEIQRAAPVAVRLLTTRSASGYLGIAERTLRTWTAAVRIPAVRFGRTARYDIRDLDALIEAAKIQA